MQRTTRKLLGMPLSAGLLAAALAFTANPAHAQFTGPTALKLINGWTTGPFGTSHLTVEKVEGVLVFRGAIATAGTNPAPFTLPPVFRPLTDVYVPLDLCNATN